MGASFQHVRALAADWRQVPMGPRGKALCEAAEALTRSCRALSPDELASLRDAGLTDEAILHLVEVIAYFNFVNRLVDGLGVAVEPVLLRLWERPD